MPYVIEPAAGLTRCVLAFLLDAYDEDEAPNAKGGVDKRTVLRLDPRLAPVKVAVLPLSRNADLSPKARDLAAELRRRWNVDFDDAGAIGRRYRRQDEIGTPFCVTVDFDTLDGPGRHRPRARLDGPGAHPARGPAHVAGRAPAGVLTGRSGPGRPVAGALCGIGRMWPNPRSPRPFRDSDEPDAPGPYPPVAWARCSRPPGPPRPPCRGPGRPAPGWAGGRAVRRLR